MLKNVNCIIPGIYKFTNDTQLNECTDWRSASETFQNFLDIKYDFIASNSKHGCPLPCTEVSFVFETFYLHRNSWIETKQETELPNGVYQIKISYSSLHVKERVVTLVYDLENFLTSLGGNLGLFLGFSCLSLMLIAVELTKKFKK